MKWKKVAHIIIQEVRNLNEIKRIRNVHDLILHW